MSLWDLPPWEQLPYFSSVRETTLVNPTTATVACLPNNQRCGVIFSCTSAGVTMTLSTLSTIAAGGKGLAVPSAVSTVGFFTNQHGILPSLQWYVISNSNVQVLELLLQDWPQQGDHYLDSIKSPPPQNIATVLPTKQGVGGLQGVSSYWKALMAKIKGG